MSRSNRISRPWTHRRLGLGAADPAVARTDALLTAVGARRMPIAGTAAHTFDAALFDFVCDLDLTAGIRYIDQTPIPLALLRAPVPRHRRRPRLRVLIPATTGGLAAVALGLTMMLVGGTPMPSAPVSSATAQSKQLLTHADMLLTAASSATPTDRNKLVTEAKADLTHVSRLLPLAAPQSRPAIRQQLQRLDRRIHPLTTPHHSRAGAGDRANDNHRSEESTAPTTEVGSSPSGDGNDGSAAPLRRRTPAQQPAPTTRTGQQPTTTQSPPPRVQSDPATAQPGAMQSTSNQPPPGGAPRPRP